MISVGPVKIIWRHWAAFALVVVGVFSKDIHDALLAGTPITWGCLAASGLGGAIWMAFEDSILPDIINGGSAGSSKTVAKKDCCSPTPPTNARTMMLLALLAAIVACVPACKNFQAAYPVLDQIEEEIVKDLQVGMTPVQIEEDIARGLCPPPATQDCVDVVVIVNDAVTFLIDMGVIPTGLIPQAKQLQALEQGKLTARSHK